MRKQVERIDAARSNLIQEIEMLSKIGCELPDKKINEIMALATASEDDGKYKFVGYYGSKGTKHCCTATVTLEVSDNEKTCEIHDSAIGNTLPNAAFRAIQRIGGVKFDHINCREIKMSQQAQRLVVLEISKPNSNESYWGIGISSDVDEASMQAFVRAMNMSLANH